MKKTYIGFAGLGLLLILGTQQVQAQQGFGTDKPHKTAAVDIQSSKRGLLIPRVDLVATTNGTTPINGPKQSLLVYNQATSAKDPATATATDVTPGYYYWDTNRWVRFAQQGDITAIELKGDVTGPTNATIVGAIQGVTVSSTTPTANQVLTFIPGTEGKPGQWVPTSITPDAITDAKGITGTGITVGGGAGATLKDVTLAIAHGGKNQVMVTNDEGTGTTWVDQSTIAPATTHTVVKDATGNTLTSTVNGVAAAVNLVDKVTNTVTGTAIQTTVNGVISESVDLKDAIQAGQKTTSVAAHDNKVSVVTNGAGTTGNNTEYTVGVVEANLNLASIGGSLNPVQIAPGTEGQVLTTVPPKAGTTTPSVEWQTPAAHENIYTHDGTLVSTEANFYKRTVDFGTFNSFMFKRGTQSHDFTYDSSHTGLNLRGNETSSMGLLSKGTSLIFEHSKMESLIQSHADNGLKIVAENGKDIYFGTSGRTDNNDNVVFQGNGGVQVVNINKPEFKGAATDKVVVADGTGVLKTVERKKMAPQFFYMPAVIFNTKTKGNGITRDLYQDYVNQFTTAKGTAYNIAHGANGGSLAYDGGVIGSTGAPAAMEVYGRGELYYYVTYYDKNVFANISINANGELKYDIIGTATPASYMNIVFVIK